MKLHTNSVIPNIGLHYFTRKKSAVSSPKWQFPHDFKWNQIKDLLFLLGWTCAVGKRQLFPAKNNWQFPHDIKWNQIQNWSFLTLGCITSLGRKQLFPASNGSFRMMTTNHVRDRRRHGPSLAPAMRPAWYENSANKCMNWVVPLNTTVQLISIKKGQC